MRADRLVAALLLMQARGRVTAAELAQELEVSVKTARRDLESLSTAGLPVYAQPGRGGGWQLLGGGRTDLSGLNAAEARALFLIAGPHTRLAPEASRRCASWYGRCPSRFARTRRRPRTQSYSMRRIGVLPRQGLLPTLMCSSARSSSECASG